VFTFFGPWSQETMNKYNRACAACHVSGIAGAPKAMMSQPGELEWSKVWARWWL